MNFEIPPVDRWGPFCDGLDPAEYVARCRALRVIVHLLCGPRGDALCDVLRTAEAEPWMIPTAVALLNALPSRDIRSVVASYGWVSCPGWSA